MTRDVNLERIQQGKAATLVESVLGDLVQDHVDLCVNKLVQEYRSGEIRHDALVGLVAEISAMQTLMTNIETKQRLGEVAAEREFGRNGSI